MKNIIKKIKKMDNEDKFILTLLVTTILIVGSTAIALLMKIIGQILCL